ncbi:MAG: DUF86 domain-containing protein [Sedimentisphaerales bacterium]|nr:DUF86 domain-containing protein [Sedimentisphaerales bacterium]
MKRDYSVYLSDILQAFRNACQFLEGLSYDEFIDDRKTTSAVVRELEIVGEAVKQLPPSIRKKYPEIPWSDMAGMRDKLIHFYFGVDMEIVWKTVKERIPKLEPLIHNVLSDLEQ